MSDASSFRRFGLVSIIACTFLLALALFIAWGIYRASFPPKPPLQGQMQARTISVASKVSGRVSAILVKEGDMVRKGQPVAELALPGLEAKLVQARAEVAEAREKQSLVDEGPRSQRKDAARAEWERALAAADLAHKTYERIAALRRDGLVSAERFDQAKAQMLASQQEALAAREEYELVQLGAREQEKSAAADQSAQAEAGVREVESLTEDRLLSASRDAQVERVILVEGEIAGAGFPVLTLVDINDQWASFNVLEKDMPSMVMGSILEASIPALNQDKVKFEIYFISPRASYATWRSTREDSGYDMKTFEIRARPQEILPNLRPGMSVLVNLP